MAKSSRRRKTTAEAAKQTKKQIAFSRKEARQNRIILIGVGVLIAVIVLILAFGVVQELVLKPTAAVATVNGAKVPMDDFQDLLTYNRYNQYVNMSNLQTSLDDLNASPEENQFLISFYEQQLTQLQSSVALLPQTTLDELIEDELIRQQAEADGMAVSADEVEEAISGDLRLALSSAPQEPITGTEQLPTATPIPQDQIDELYNTILGNMHLTDKALREIVRRNILRGKLQEVLASEVPTTGLVINVQLIKTETEEEALTAKGRIEGGEDFAIVAQEVSTDTLSAADGGDLGWMTPDQLLGRYGEPLSSSATTAEVGELVVLESNGMYYVIRVMDRDENGPLPAEVLSAQQNSALRDWLAERQASPDVQIERLLEADQIPSDPFASSTGL
jgi:parvulin-like peptidyl-prolyl isomerase